MLAPFSAPAVCHLCPGRWGWEGERSQQLHYSDEEGGAWGQLASFRVQADSEHAWGVNTRFQSQFLEIDSPVYNFSSPWDKASAPDLAFGPFESNYAFSPAPLRSTIAASKTTQGFLRLGTFSLHGQPGEGQNSRLGPEGPTDE